MFAQFGAGADGALGNQLERKRENSKTLTPIARPGETTKHKSSRAQGMPNTIHTDRATQCGGGSRMRSFSRSASFLLNQALRQTLYEALVTESARACSYSSS